MADFAVAGVLLSSVADSSLSLAVDSAVSSVVNGSSEISVSYPAASLPHILTC